LIDEYVGEVLDLLDPVIDGASQIEPEIKGDLVVTGTPRVKTARVASDQFAEPTLDGSVNILVSVPELEPPRMRLFEDVSESSLDPGHSTGIEQADLAKHGDMSE
jgi:hypothetical protein